MTFLAGIIGLIGRFAGKLLTTTLGWASSLLFGRVPGNRQVVLALVTFGSVVWAVLVVGVVLPYVGAFLLAAVPAPGLISESWLRLAMLIGALVVPAVVGAATLFVVEPARRPTGRAIVGQVLRGYPLSAALAATLVLLALVGIARFVHHLALRWSDAHVGIVVRPGGYARVVADLERALDDAGLEVTARDAPAVLAVPGRMLGAVAGSAIRSLMPDRMVQLAGPGLEVGLYPSDIAISGDKLRVARARAAIASRLTGTAAWMTTSAEAQEIEARLERLSSADAPGGEPGGAAGQAPAAARTNAAAELAAVDAALATLEVSHEEWEVLYRQRLQVERDLLAGARAGVSFPGADPAKVGSAAGAAGGGARAAAGSGASAPLPGWVSAGAAAGAMALVVVDIALAIADRRRP
jgi:hypothetical protein